MRHLSAPVKVSVDVTDRCNLGCIHCRVRGARGAADEIDGEVFRALAQDLAAIGVFRLGLSGGEPLLRDDLEELVEYALAAGVPRVIVSTNGVALTSSRLARLRQHRQQLTLKISIDGPQEVHDEVRGWPGAFAAAVEAARAARAAGIEVHVTTALMRPTAPYLEQVLRLVQGFDVQRHYLIEVVPPAGTAESLALTPAERQRLGRILRDDVAATRPSGCARIVKLPFVSPSGDGLECCAGVTECGVLSDGAIVGCRLLPRLQEGRVQDRPLSAVWRERRAFAHYRQTRRGLPHQCRQCATGSSCRGGCRAFAAALGRPRGPDPRCPVAAQSH